MYIPSLLIDWKDASRTVAQISESTLLFKIGIISQSCSFILFIALPLLLYRILSPVNLFLAQCMVLLAVLSVPIQFVSIAELFTTIALVENQSAYYQALSITQREAMMMASLDAHHYGMYVGQIFWGLWLLPFGLLVHKSKFLPSFLGFFLILGA